MYETLRDLCDSDDETSDVESSDSDSSNNNSSSSDSETEATVPKNKQTKKILRKEKKDKEQPVAVVKNKDDSAVSEIINEFKNMSLMIGKLVNNSNAKTTNNSNETKKKRTTCWNCISTEHYTRDCTKP